MKLFIAILIGFVLAIPFSKAQRISPGGVPGTILWARAKISNNQALIFQIETFEDSFSLSPENMSVTNELPQFNFHPALPFNGLQTRLDLPLRQRDLSKLTIFTVLHPGDSLTEKSVWYFEKDAEAELLFTTHRMADLKEGLFMNFVKHQAGLPFVHAYDQFQNTDSILPMVQRLVIGPKPVSLNAPIQSYKGLIAELIVYDRVLSPRERQQVASYLAIKYGVMLSPPQTAVYTNAEGQTILDGRKNGKFHYRITGIGRDDEAGLNQKQSSSSYEPALLEIGALQLAASNDKNPAILASNSYLIWSDNNERLGFAPKIQGRPRFIARKWLMNRFGEMQNTPTLLRFDTKAMIEATLKEGEIWWIAVDRSGTGKFEAQDVEYFSQDENSNGQVILKDIHWDTDGSGFDWFAIGTGPAMMGKIWVEQPDCATPSNGELYIGAEGGKPPYSIVVKDDGGSFYWQGTNQTSDLAIVSGIQSGDYQLTITDGDGRIFRDSIYVESRDAPASTLASSYLLMPDQRLQLNAATGITTNELTFYWSGPGGFSSTSPEVSIKIPGVYRLVIERAGCTSRRDIGVKAWQTDNFNKISLFPNPARDGSFQVVISLHRVENVDIVISDASGRRILIQTFVGSDYYKCPIKLPVPTGIYSVSLRCGETVKVFQVVVE